MRVGSRTGTLLTQRPGKLLIGLRLLLAPARCALPAASHLPLPLRLIAKTRVELIGKTVESTGQMLPCPFVLNDEFDTRSCRIEFDLDLQRAEICGGQPKTRFAAPAHFLKDVLAGFVRPCLLSVRKRTA